MKLEVDESAVNELVLDGLRNLIKRAKGARWSDVQLRINGEFEQYEADWIRHMRILDD